MNLNQENIRNFCIIAHVDHGKSTLADRFLEITNTLPKEKMHEQFLDQNPIGRERGITIKLAPVRMSYALDDKSYILNLIDTPGHADFSYEVSRTLACCEGAVLLVDAVAGIQAQTVAHFREAKKENLTIIPVINKIDLPNAQIDTVTKELTEMLKINKEDILLISAKTGQGVDALLEEIIRKIPPPEGKTDEPLRALIFDAYYDQHRGVVAYVKVVDGLIKTGDKIELLREKTKTVASELGWLTPSPLKTDYLKQGEIGYVATGIKNIRECKIGDTITLSPLNPESSVLKPLPGYNVPKPMVFLDMYSKDKNGYQNLKEAVEKLSLNDSSLTFSPIFSSFLGAGLRVGFLGLLHAQIIRERLMREGNVQPLLTAPKVIYKTENGILKEPYIILTVYAPKDYLGKIMSLCQKERNTMINISYYESYAIVRYEMPYVTVIKGLASDIKSVSSGFGSIDYEVLDFRPAEVVELEIIINKRPIDILTELIYKDEVGLEARIKVEKLKEALPKKQYRQIIQAVADGKILARSEIPPFRKDVLSKMSGGDRTRKDKLLEQQKKGKKKLTLEAQFNIPQKALFSLMENN
ncbi:GTP-binding protein [Patescibacteria group bacterium]|nr:GTP-binding protein [Patescibacteria group bacterium]MCL5010050.1 GTP-binding protein [Patescibacteria group bacterium]